MYGQRGLSSALRGPTTAEILVLAVVGFLIYGVIATAQRWTAELSPSITIDLSLRALPTYAVYSLFRAFIAYGVSLAFTLVVGYAAAKNKIAERIILPLLDIGQSIPVLGFLPGLVLSLTYLFPHTNTGLELACILAVFTGQVWNLTFAFYASVKAVPTQIQEMSEIAGMSRMRRLFSIELPYSATGLAWNSLMSMAGGWFFITVSESFTFGDKDFHLPGLGSYMAIAMEKGDQVAIIAGVSAMLFLILSLDFLLWRPIIAWTGRFQADQGSTTDTDIPFVSLLLKESRVVKALVNFVSETFKEVRAKMSERRAGEIERQKTPKADRSRRLKRWWKKSPAARRASQVLLSLALGIFAFYVIGQLYTLIAPLRWPSWRLVLEGTLATSLRVFFGLVLATIWTVPVGIAIGLSPRATKILQPIVQLAASFPAPMLYPIILTFFGWMSIGLTFSSLFLMMFGIQWYILFNVLSGAMGISSDYRQNFRLLNLGRREHWLGLYIPSVFPSLVTGWVTAAGGAWNASIISEAVRYRGENLNTLGLGSVISQATAKGDYPLLCASLLVMVVTVVGLNRLVWKRLYHLAETRYRFDR